MFSASIRACEGPTLACKSRNTCSQTAIAAAEYSVEAPTSHCSSLEYLSRGRWLRIHQLLQLSCRGQELYPDQKVIR